MKRNLRIAKYIVYRNTINNTNDVFWSFSGSFAGISLIGFIHSFIVEASDVVFFIGSLGASAILLFGCSNSPLSQPRNVIGGNILSAIVGVTAQYALSGFHIDWLTSAVAVSVALLVMQLTNTVHPPGGATAMIATIGSAKIKSLGYLYVLTPVASGVFILIVVALIINNIPRHRRYPYKSMNEKTTQLIK
ncbi:MAG: HPP family protein [Cytophagales bacterium]|nr:HPP family protein [Cytophaga sp.]